MIRGFLLATALVLGGLSDPALGQVARLGGLTITPAQSDEVVIEQLVRLYRQDPKTYPASVAFLEQNRPYLVDRFNGLTLRGPSPSAAAATQRTQAGGASRPTRPSPAAPTRNPGNASVYDGATAVQGNGLFIALGVLGLAAAAGGGGGGGEDGGSPTIVPGSREFFETQEYRRSYGLGMINAATRYAAGGQGQGVTIGILDGGIDVFNPEFANRIDFAGSVSYFGSGSLQDNDGHGTHVAGILAGAKNDRGTHGVAFSSRLAVYNAIAGPNDIFAAPRSFYSDVLRRASASGLRVMNHSWGLGDVTIASFGNRQALETFLKQSFDESILDAFETGKRANLLNVFAAGNEGGRDPSFLGAVPVLMPEYAGYFLSVVAVDSGGNIAGFSNRCGMAKDFCLAAPGVDVPSTRLGGSGDSNVTLLSGTSMAAPYVSGAAALLLSQWPELDAPTLSSLLLNTATDLGAPGVDEVYGHGLLNIANATRPVGALRIYGGDSVTDPATPLVDSGIVASGAMAGALSAALSQRDMIVADNYDRGFQMDMSQLLVAGDSGPSALALVQTEDSARGLRLASTPGAGTAYGVENAGFSTWYGASRAVARSAGLIDHSTLLEGGTTGQFGVSLGGGWDMRMTASFSDEGQGTGNAYSIGLYGSGPMRVSFGLGQLNEQDRVLGAAFQGASGQNGSALTNFVSLGAGVTLGQGLDVDLQAVFGETDFTQNGLVTGGRNMSSTGARLSISRPVAAQSGARVGFNVALPIVVTEGTLTVDVPVQRAAAVDGVASRSVLRETEDIAFVNDTRPVDVSLSYVLPITGARNFGVVLEGGYRVIAGQDSEPFAGFAFTRRF